MTINLIKWIYISSYITIIDYISNNCHFYKQEKKIDHVKVFINCIFFYLNNNVYDIIILFNFKNIHKLGICVIIEFILYKNTNNDYHDFNKSLSLKI